MSRLTPDPLSADSFRRFYGDILNYLRKRTDNPSDAAYMTGARRLKQLKGVLVEPSPRRREALMLQSFEGLSQAQFAQRMGISLSMLEKHIAFALLHCKQRLDHEKGTEQPE
jgi:RNA polymerase sigma-70 factor (ECF subfamily)